MLQENRKGGWGKGEMAMEQTRDAGRGECVREIAVGRGIEEGVEGNRGVRGVEGNRGGCGGQQRRVWRAIEEGVEGNRGGCGGHTRHILSHTCTGKRCVYKYDTSQVR